MKTQSFTVNLTGPQAKFLKTLAAEFRADPGDMLAALALGSVAGNDTEVAVQMIHSALFEVLTLKRVPQVSLPLNLVPCMGYDEQEGAAA
jgi:hypothetical protein